MSTQSVAAEKDVKAMEQTFYKEHAVLERQENLQRTNDIARNKVNASNMLMHR